MTKDVEFNYSKLRNLIGINFGYKVFIVRTKLNEIILETAVDNISEVCFFLKNNEECCFEQLVDLCCIDYSLYKHVTFNVTAADSGFSRAVDGNISTDFENKDRFVIVYNLLSICSNFRVRIRCLVQYDNLLVPSVSDIWPSANWYEREVYDLFGIYFLGHPFLHRILTDYNFEGYPLRKDFPLIGYKDLKYNVDSKKCVYDIVNIKNEILNIKIIR